MTQDEYNYIKDSFSQIIDDIAGNPEWQEAAKAVAADLGALESKLSAVAKTKAKQDSIMRKYAFLERHGIELCWRHAFSCISEDGKAAAENDIYYVTEDNRFLIKIPKGEASALCLDIRDLDLLPREDNIPTLPDTIPEYGIKLQ